MRDGQESGEYRVGSKMPSPFLQTKHTRSAFQGSTQFPACLRSLLSALPFGHLISGILLVSNVVHAKFCHGRLHLSMDQILCLVKEACNHGSHRLLLLIDLELYKGSDPRHYCNGEGSREVSSETRP